MTTRRSDSVDYASQCTVCIIFDDAGTENRLVYERPQPQLPDTPLSVFDAIRVKVFPDDDALTDEARRIFADMKHKGRISNTAALSGIFIARTAAAALEMNL